MGMAERFWQAVAAKATQNQVARTWEVCQMAGGDVDGFDVVAGTEYFADYVSVEIEGSIPATLELEGLVVAAETALGAAHRRDLQAQSQMAGQAQFAGMSQALPVTEEDLRGPLQELVCGQ